MKTDARNAIPMGRRTGMSGPPRAVVVSGFICTGSSALIDALRGDDAITAFLPEFQILGGKDGLFEVVEALERDKAQGMAKFRRFAKRIVEEGRCPNRAYYYRRSVMRKVGAGACFSPYHRNSYGKTLEGYQKATRVYLREMAWRLRTAEKPEQMVTNIEKATNDYFRHLCEQIRGNQNALWTIFNQTIKPGGRTGLGLSLIRDARVIVVDRDPRDQYIDLVQRNRLGSIIQKYGNPSGDLVGDYIRWYRRRREKFYKFYAGHERVLVVRFENLCRNPASVLRKVAEFLELEDEIKVDSSLFDQKIALGKVGMWKEFYDRESIARIEEDLSEYCAAN